MKSEGYYDAIIIGGGLAGLTVGNILAYKGYRTLIIEKNAKPGGYAMNFKRKDYRFDVSCHLVHGGGPGGIVNWVFESFDGKDIVEWLPIKQFVHWIDYQNNYEAKPPVEYNQFIEFLCKDFPHEEKNIRKFMRNYGTIYATLMNLMKPGMKNRIKNLFKGIPDLLHLLGTIFRTLDPMMNKYFKDPALIELLTFFFSPFELPRQNISFFLWLAAEMGYHTDGAWYPKGGSGELGSAMAKHFQKNGGKLLLNYEVTFIDIKNRIAEAVICKDKKGNAHKFTSAAVVNAADLRRLAKELVPEGTFSKGWIKKLESKETLETAVVVYLGLDIDLKEYGFDDYALWTLNRKFRDGKHHDRIYNKLDYSKLPHEAIMFYSNGPDKTCCPPGKSLLSYTVSSKLSTWQSLLDEDGKRGKKYKEAKDECGWQVVDRLAELFKIPDLREAVEVMEVATPLTLQRYTYNYNGAPMGWKVDLENSIKKLQLWGTRIKNLSLAGQYTFPGGGMSAVIAGGVQAANTAIGRIKKYQRKAVDRYKQER